MSDEDILNRMPEENALVDFPPVRTIGNLQVRVDYHFDPGSERDGVTFRLPLGFAPALNTDTFDWLVPGLLQEKLTYLLKSLPKSIRKNLVPISDTVNRLLDDIDFGKGSLFSALESSILKQFKLLIPRSAWAESLPLHLQPRYLVFDDSGTELGSGRNLGELLDTQDLSGQKVQRTSLRKADQKLFDQWQGSSHTTWDFQGLPAALPIYTPQGEVAGFFHPMLVPEPDLGSVRVLFARDSQEASTANRRGILFLYRLQFRSQYTALKKMCTTSFSGPSTVPLLDLGKSRKDIIEELLDFILASIFPLAAPTIPDKEEFLKNIELVKKRGLFSQGQEICQKLLSLFQKRRELQNAMHKIFANDTRNLLFSDDKRREFEAHLEEIFPRNILAHELPADLDHIERQLQCLAIRLDRFYADPTKDSHKAAQIDSYLQNLRFITKKRADLTEESAALVARYRAMVDEYRIAIFSPEMKTREKISPKKLDKQWQDLLSKYSKR